MSAGRTTDGSGIRRVRFGTILRPAEETADGRARVEALDGFVVPLVDGLLLFDTGIATGDADVDAHYRPVRIPLEQALAAAGVRVDEITAVANCHLHLDHAGGNPLLPGRPIHVQRAELAAARGQDYTVGGVVDFPDARYQVHDGAADLAPGVRLVPTPGHTAGHQSLVVDAPHGRVLLAGQTHDTASAWTADVAAVLRPDPLLPAVPEWLAPLLDGLAEARFAHDAAVWLA